MKTVIMYAAGVHTPKKESTVQSVYLNYGILGLATNIKERTGYDVAVFQGDNKRIEEILLESAEALERLDDTTPIFISIPSFLALSWTRDLIAALKSAYPNPVVVGGRWVLDPNPKWILEKLPQVDYFSFGTPDETVELLLDSKNWASYVPSMYQKTFSRLDYTLLHDYQKYQPVVEVQRGCGMGCSFCLESSFKMTELKPVPILIEELKELISMYGTGDLNIYFEASHFHPSAKWAKEFAKAYQKENFTFQWRMTTRVDTINIEALEYLAKTNLKVVDLGLESASHVQLLRMNKTKNPKAYLTRAEQVIQTCKRLGIWAKLNILLYLNETQDTLNETHSWLIKHKDYIKGISINPLTVYLNGEASTLAYVADIERQTGTKVDKKTLFQDGFAYVDLSPEITIEKTQEICKQWAREMMMPEDFYDLKKISYTYR